MSELEVKVDVAGQLRLFKTVTFTDPYAFVDEAMQNAQRAKATELIVTVSEDKIEFHDNGIGLSDPSSLFTMSKTGWDEQTKDDQNPFGLGFFSCVALANMVRVESNEFYYNFDVDRLINSGNTSIDMGQLDEPVKGFRVILTELEDKFSLWTMKEKVKASAKFISQFKTIMNGEELEHIVYTKTDGSRFAYIIDLPGLSGWIRPVTWSDYMENKGLKVYHQDRFVKNIEMYGVAGIISVGRNLLNFRAPDRRDIIDDEKYSKFLEYIKSVPVKKMLLDLIIRGLDDDLSNYQEVLDRYLTEKDYKDMMRYLVIENKDQLDKIEKVKSDELRWISASKLKELFIIDESDNTDRSQQVELEETTKRSIGIKPGDHPISSSSSSHSSGSTTNIKKSDIPKAIIQREGVSIDSLGNKVLLYYVEPKDLKAHGDIIEQALDCSIPVIVVKNKLELKILSAMPQAKYLGTLDHKIVYKVKVDHSGCMNQREWKAFRILGLVSTIAGFDKNVFRIGDLRYTKHVMFGDKMVKTEKATEPIIYCGHAIVVDRRLVKGSSIQDNEDPKLNIGELFFVLNNLELIVQNLLEVIRVVQGKQTKRALKKITEGVKLNPNDLNYNNDKFLPTSQTLMTHIIKELSTNKVYDWLGL